MREDDLGLRLTSKSNFLYLWSISISKTMGLVLQGIIEQYMGLAFMLLKIQYEEQKHIQITVRLNMRKNSWEIYRIGKSLLLLFVAN